jgi:hypothetical protein
MPLLLQQADDVLRARSWYVEERRLGTHLLSIALLMVVFGVIYGTIMGAYAGTGSMRLIQMAFSAIKVPLLLGVSFVISVPSFFVINTLFGVRDDFRQVLRALIATQAGLTIVLASFAPLTILWYLSIESYQAAKMFNLLMFGMASIMAQMLLRKYYQPLIERNRTHLKLMRVWLVIYAFVGIQLAWMLRPFIGHPDSPTTFFREEAWGNAYVKVATTLWHLLVSGN